MEKTIKDVFDLQGDLEEVARCMTIGYLLGKSVKAAFDELPDPDGSSTGEDHNNAYREAVTALMMKKVGVQFPVSEMTLTEEQVVVLSEWFANIGGQLLFNF